MPGGKQKPFHVDCRFAVDVDQIEAVRARTSRGSKYVWVSRVESSENRRKRTDRLSVCTIKGVPGTQVDLLLPDSTYLAPEGMAWICEIGRKQGSYDGNVRWRITFRLWATPWDPERSKESSLQYPGPGKITIEEEQGYDLAVIARWRPKGFWAQSFTQIPYEIQVGADHTGCIITCWQKWFHFLPPEEVRATAAEWNLWPEVKACNDVCLLNRLAHDALYQLANNLGWRKLDLRARRRLGLADDSPQWHHMDGLLLTRAREAKEGNATGCGDSTIRTAHGVYREDEFCESR